MHKFNGCQILIQDEIEEHEQIIAEENARQDIIDLVQELEMYDEVGEYDELLEKAHMTARNNPISETAEDVKEELTIAIRELC